jgi:hypothetical protein
MKTINPVRIPLIATVLSLAPFATGLAADTNSAASDTVAAAPAVLALTPARSAPVKLPYGAEDVLKLSRAQISEDLIMNYVQSSGTIYNLAPKDIVYLRDQGVSERVINTMLDQRKRVELSAQAAMPAEPTTVPNAPTVAPAPTVPDAGNAAPAPAYPDQPPAYAEAPLTPPASSVYVIPYSGYNGYYASGYYPYSPYCWGPGYYGGWYGPSVAIGFGFGGYGGFHRDGFRGGFHGGFHGGHR